LPSAGEEHGSRNVHQDHHTQFLFLQFAFDERRLHTGRDIPVDLTRVVSRLIRLVFIEFKAAPPDPAQIVARAMIPHGAGREDLHVTQPVDECMGQHG
jgi:hypothetical protein